MCDEQMDGQDKNNMSPHQSGGRHNVNNYMYEEQSILNIIPRASIRNKNMIWTFEFIDMGILLIISVLQLFISDIKKNILAVIYHVKDYQIYLTCQTYN